MRTATFVPDELDSQGTSVLDHDSRRRYRPPITRLELGAVEASHRVLAAWAYETWTRNEQLSHESGVGCWESREPAW